MRFVILPVVLLGLIAGLRTEVLAAPLFHSLPEDGTEVRYFTVLKVEDREENPDYRIRSVGRKQVQGTDCRWIEFDATLKEGQVLFKLLIPEAAFEKKDTNPVDKAVEIWVKRPNEDVRKVESMAEADPVLNLLLAGPEANVITGTEKRKVEWQNGAFECTVESGTRKTLIGALDMTARFEHFLNEKAPFGFAKTRVHLEAPTGGKLLVVDLETSIVEITRKAESRLRDIQ